MSDSLFAIEMTTLANPDVLMPRIPVQLMEAGANLALFIILAVLFFRAADAFRMLGFYLCAYGAIRFVMEMFRGDALRGIWLLSTSQWIALILIPLGIAMMCRPDWFGRALLRMQKKE